MEAIRPIIRGWHHRLGLPAIPGFFIVSAVYMVAEKVADVILESWTGSMMDVKAFDAGVMAFRPFHVALPELRITGGCVDPCRVQEQVRFNRAWCDSPIGSRPSGLSRTLGIAVSAASASVSRCRDQLVGRKRWWQTSVPRITARHQRVISGSCCSWRGPGGTLARVRCARPALDLRATLRLYVERVPEVGYKNSCIFHGKQGCTLDRPLRSEVCNSYFCGGLQGYLTGDDVVTPTMIIAGVGDKMRTSPILIP
jgi:hypothetical protein